MNSRLSTLNSQPSMELHIEELVLHGFAPGDRYVIGEAVERQLALLLGKEGIPNLLRSENAIDEIKGATFNAAYNTQPNAIGKQIAQTVYQGFSQ
jgi:hypothetical protein